LNAAEKVQAIDQLISKLKSERDFIIKETTIVMDDADECVVQQSN
jgi:hypothetical protein